MGFNYDPDALPVVNQAIANIEEYISGLPNRISILESIAEQSGAKKFQEQVESLKVASTASVNTLKDFVGEDGDKAADGTLKGCASTLKKLDSVMN